MQDRVVTIALGVQLVPDILAVRDVACRIMLSSDQGLRNKERLDHRVDRTSDWKQQKKRISKREKECRMGREQHSRRIRQSSHASYAVSGA